MHQFQLLQTVFTVTFLCGRSFAESRAEVYSHNEWYTRPTFDRYATAEPIGTPLYTQFLNNEPGYTTPQHAIRKPAPTPLYDNYVTASPSDGTPLHIRHTSPEPDTTPLYGYWPLDYLRGDPNRLTNIIQTRPELVETPLHDRYEVFEYGRPPLYGHWHEREHFENALSPVAMTTYVNRYGPNTLPGPPLKFWALNGDRQAGTSLGGIMGSGFSSILNPYLGDLGTTLGRFLGPILGSLGNALLRLLSSMNIGTRTPAPSVATPSVNKHYDAYLVDFPEYGKHIVLTDPSKPNPFLKPKEEAKDKLASAKPLDKKGEEGKAKNAVVNINDDDFAVDNFKNLMAHQELLLQVQDAEDEATDADDLISSN